MWPSRSMRGNCSRKSSACMARPRDCGPWPEIVHVLPRGLCARGRFSASPAIPPLASLAEGVESWAELSDKPRPCSGRSFLLAFHKAPAALARARGERDYTEATPVQAAILEAEAEGRDLLVSAQTGSGKTVAYGI